MQEDFVSNKSGVVEQLDISRFYKFFMCCSGACGKFRHVFRGALSAKAQGWIMALHSVSLGAL